MAAKRATRSACKQPRGLYGIVPSLLSEAGHRDTPQSMIIQRHQGYFRGSALKGNTVKDGSYFQCVQGGGVCLHQNGDRFLHIELFEQAEAPRVAPCSYSTASICSERRGCVSNQSNIRLEQVIGLSKTSLWEENCVCETEGRLMSSQGLSCMCTEFQGVLNQKIQKQGSNQKPEALPPQPLLLYACTTSSIT
eukprot:scaffold256426_cov20-Tisochrysis_lutea.AAC.1